MQTQKTKRETEKYLNPVAEKDSADSGRIMTPEEAYPLRKDFQFFCPDHDCLDSERKLIPAKSKLGNLFFKHKPNYTHDIQPQTLLHKLAVKWFEKKEEFEIPRFELDDKIVKQQKISIDSERTKLEYRQLERIIPDVIMTTIDGFEFAIEVVVTSDINEDKRKLIEKFELPTVRIILSDFYNKEPHKCRTDYSYIHQSLDHLLTNPELKSWVIAPKKIVDSISFEEKSTGNSGCLLGIVIGTIYLLTRK